MEQTLIKINKRGFWEGEDAVAGHYHDHHLSHALVEFFKKENAKTIVDFGCGTGHYLKNFLNNDFQAEGYDGNPQTPQISGGLAKVLDLSESFDLGKRFDWVMSLEVGEHLPKEFEKIYFDNLHRHNTKGIVLTWAVKGQGGDGHVNEQNNDYIKNIMANYGYANDVAAENELRMRASLWWFKATIMVFRKL